MVKLVNYTSMIVSRSMETLRYMGMLKYQNRQRMLLLRRQKMAVERLTHRGLLYKKNRKMMGQLVMIKVVMTITKKEKPRRDARVR